MKSDLLEFLNNIKDEWKEDLDILEMRMPRYGTDTDVMPTDWLSVCTNLNLAIVNLDKLIKEQSNES